MPESPKAQWMVLAHLLRPQGRRGELLAEPLTDLAELFADGQPVWLAPIGASAPADPEAASLTLEDHWLPTGKNAGRIVVKLSGCDTISAAEALAGQQLLLPSNRLPALDPDTFFVGDLVGCTLYDGDATAGTVIDLHFATGPDGRTRLPDAAPLLVIQLPGGPNAEPILVPFVRAWLDSVDIAEKRIYMHLPAGLLDPSPTEDSQLEARHSKP